jgi:hypothetical protein
MTVGYEAALWYSQVLPGGTDRHRDRTGEVVHAINATRTSMRGVSRQVMEEEEKAAGWLIEALCQAEAHLPPVPLILPRSATPYSSQAAYVVPVSYRAVLRVVDHMQEWGFIEVSTGSVGKGYTRIRPLGDLQVYCRSHSNTWVLRPAKAPCELLVVTSGKDKKVRRMLQDDEHPDAPSWRTNLQRVNDFLRRQCIHLRTTDAHLAQLLHAIEAHQAAKAKREPSSSPRLVQYGQVSLHRSFSERVGLGGRFYGGWWQNVASGLRPYVWINQWQGIERDYSGMAIRCLYAEEDIPVPADPYDIGLEYRGSDDPRRKVVKKVVNALINDKDETYWVGNEEINLLQMTRRELDRRVREAHRGIAHHFHTDAGLRMQFLDSRMIAIGAVCLPIHDSFIVQAPFASELERVMADAFQEVTGAVALIRPETPASVDHYETTEPPRAVLDDPAALHAWLDRQWDRSSIANTYFQSWAAHVLGEEGTATMIRDLNDVPRHLLPHHAFPLDLLRLD